MQVRNMIIDTQKAGNPSNIIIKKIIILKYRKHTYIGNQAQYKVSFLFPLVWLIFKKNTSEVIYDDREDEY